MVVIGMVVIQIVVIGIVVVALNRAYDRLHELQHSTKLVVALLLLLSLLYILFL